MATRDLLVGAIDFGTTYSGWAFSFLHDFQADPTKATVKQWFSSGTLVTEKAPTCLLIKSDGKTLEAFGYDAENQYRELADNEMHEKYYYFRRFKMALNKKLGENLDRNMTIEDEMGKSMNALNVFAMAIDFLVGDMMKNVKDKLTSAIGKDEVHWVLTVPAIWTDAAKQFMREAAVQAGLLTNKLTIALEPEAASIFCRHLSVDTAISGGNISIAKMPVGTRYMVLDAGGGTIDITVHEVVSENSVKEIQSASGGGWGGMLVDKAFENLIIDLTGRKVYDVFKRTETEDWLDLWRDFEVKKRGVAPEKTARVNMKFPLSLSNTFEKVTKGKLMDAIEASKYTKDIQFGGDKIKISASLFKSLFEHSIGKTIGHVSALLRDENTRKIKSILMVGGYSESPLLQHAIKEAFPDVDVVIPIGASSTIVRGALVYGHSPISIRERVLKYTYGVGTTQPFKEGIDPEHLKLQAATGLRCKTFSKHVEKGQVVRCHEPQVERGYRTNQTFQRRIKFPIYATELTKARYTDDCTYIGEIRLDLENPDELPGRRVVVSMTFSGTEIVVKAVDEKTGRDTHVFVNFLG
ncbi:heat shock 70 kDa protein 12B-like isoform X2 [Ruditapes philippinarum]|uniref:heat shock 70 kDa protein 12B-like isoform X1 n=1 Tax=Ruditapes philippinarum TaxID=129788 RepID=UPI00295A9B6D|nr:heat shock 70 kDa protein 12B-like isoform X1 [Ruditapes philippinarum]XP_060574863.1 heat shock 70 kDa protein 12B-like isoform X2 [Ruditapes philippinarum]